MKKPTALIVLDGFGDAPPGPHNAIDQASPKFLRWLGENYPRGQLETSGECVGLPGGLMGNSEVGHMNLGAGRVVWQDITRIDSSIADGSISKNAALLGAASAVKESGGVLHLLGLVSDGGVHSSDVHLRSLLDLYRNLGVDANQVAVHALLDGRDTPPNSAIGYVTELEEYLEKEKCGRVASVIGRYYAMDRDQRWDRVERAYRCLVEGVGESAVSGRDAVLKAYARDETDEFVSPTVVGDPTPGRLQSGDALLFFNFRADRAREISLSLRDPEFDAFPTAKPRPDLSSFVSMTRYRADFPDLNIVEAFPPQPLDMVLADVVAEAGLAQLRIAETEKYAHVTYFFSGGREEERAREERVLIPSPGVATYDLKPEMSAPEVASRLVQEIGRDRFDLIVLNLANPDMVGHTGIMEAAVKAVSAVDDALAQIVPAILDVGGSVLLTADHGNCERMWDEERDCPHTAHTTHRVPLYLIGDRFKGCQLREGGSLSDASPTLLEIMGLPMPSQMTARSLII